METCIYNVHTYEWLDSLFIKVNSVVVLSTSIATPPRMLPMFA